MLEKVLGISSRKSSDIITKVQDQTNRSIRTEKGYVDSSLTLYFTCDGMHWKKKDLFVLSFLVVDWFYIFTKVGSRKKTRLDVICQRILANFCNLTNTLNSKKQCAKFKLTQPPNQNN